MRRAQYITFSAFSFYPEFSSVPKLWLNSSYSKSVFTLLVSWLDWYILYKYLRKTSYLEKDTESVRDISLYPECMIFPGKLSKAIVFDSLRFISGIQSRMIHVVCIGEIYTQQSVN